MSESVGVVMVYLSGGKFCLRERNVLDVSFRLLLGKVVERKSFLSLEGLIDLFWSFINFCVLL